MRQVVAQYIQSEKTEVLRAKKIKAMHELLGAFETEQPLTLAEIQELVQEKELRQPVFEKLIYPILAAGVEAGDIYSIKTMVKLINYLYTYQSRIKDWKYDSADLIRVGLQLNPLDIELLNRKYDSAVRSLLFSIHEVPWCVLHGNSAASEQECYELLDYTNEFEKLSQSLGKNDTELLAECRYYYRSFAEYQADRASYLNFADYLEQHPQQ
jgi:hypothetical protein